MFDGNYPSTIDDKKRACIPKKLRFRLGERVRVAKGFERCLVVHTVEDWLKFVEKYISNRSLADEKARKLRRFYLGGSRELDIDQQGRINLPVDLMEYAGIDKDAVFVGCGDYIEIWDPLLYKEEMDPKNTDPKELMRDAVIKADAAEAPDKA